MGQIDDAQAATKELEQALLSWRVQGQPVVREVIPAAKAYRGNFLTGAADLILELELEDNYTYTLLPSQRAASGQTWRKFAPHEYVGGKGLGMNGTHRQHGVLLMQGKGIASDVAIHADMADPIPTLFTAMGETIPPDHMTGGSFKQLSKLERDRATPDKTAGYPRNKPLAARTRALVRARLESLGYL